MACAGPPPTKQQVQDAIKGANLGDLSPAWLDDIVDMVQSRLSSSCESTDVSDPCNTPSDTPSTPSTEISEPLDWTPAPKPFQATVEDEDCSATRHGSVDSMASERPSSNTSRRRPKLSSSKSAPQAPTCLKPTPLEKKRLSTPPFAPSPPQSVAPSSPRLRPTVHFSERPPPKLNSRLPGRHDSASRGTSAPELSVVDLQWGRLFTGCGEPTTRLRQVLRGLASYINVEYEPRNSVVITPDKLRMFYKRCQLGTELYPFQVIFDCCSRKPMRCLEILYESLRCEYHLVQDESRDRPCIPALTTDGFVNWMSAFIQASPDTEAKRLDGIMAALPIEADSETPKGKPERLPKQLSRHLFPSKPHERTRQCVGSALKVWYDALGWSNSRPPSYLGAFRSLFSRSPSPRPRERSQRDERGPWSVRGDRETFIEVIEVPPGHLPDCQASSRSHHRSRDWDEHSSRSSRSSKSSRSSRCSAKVLVEEASERDASPRRRHHRQHRREASPRSSRSRRSGRDESRQSRHYASSQAHTTPPSSREGSPKALTKRAENYALFQGRESGPTYDEIVRKAAAPKRSQRACY